MIERSDYVCDVYLVVFLIFAFLVVTHSLYFGQILVCLIQVFLNFNLCTRGKVTHSFLFCFNNLAVKRKFF